MEKNFKFTIRNEGKSNAIGVGRLNQEQAQAVRNFMHSKTAEVRFPSGIVMVHQGSGFYHFLSPNWNEDPTDAVKKAIRLASKAIYTLRSQAKQVREHAPTTREHAYASKVFHRKNDNSIQKKRNHRSLAELLGSKFRLKQTHA